MSVLFANHGQVRVHGGGQGIRFTTCVMGPLSEPPGQFSYKTSIVLEFINFVEGQTDACHSWTNMNNVFSLILMDDKLISILSSIRLNLDMSKANKQTVHCLYNLDAPIEPNTVSHHPLTIKQSILHKQLLLLSESR